MSDQSDSAIEREVAIDIGKSRAKHRWMTTFIMESPQGKYRPVDQNFLHLYVGWKISAVVLDSGRMINEPTA